MSAEEQPVDDDVVDLGQVVPKQAIAPTRSPTGVPMLGRTMTTEEQRRALLETMRAEALKRMREAVIGVVTVRAQVRWAHGQAARFEATFQQEQAADPIATLIGWKDDRDGVGDWRRRRFLEMNEEARRIAAAGGLKGRQ